MISVFTPLSKSGNPYIEAAFETLLTQTHTDWEWVVLENHGGKLPPKIRKHPQVHCSGDTQLQGIGALKRRCCELAKGDIFFELDHDDLLHPEALAKTQAAVDAGADFVVSDFAEFRSGTWEPNVYGAEYGWTSYPVEFQGHPLLAQPNPPITPHNLRIVDFAPNHLRAWSRAGYWKIGGHDKQLSMLDDHDLVVRTYLHGLVMTHLPECLYFYRVHDQQTVHQKNAALREMAWQIYDKHFTALAEKFADDTQWRRGVRVAAGGELLKIDLCGGIDPAPGYKALDQVLGHDLDEPWPLADNSVGVIRAMDAIEHLVDPIHTMNEAYRVLAPGGFLLITVPSTDGRGAWQDPTHVSFWNENSFWYYTKATHARYIPEFKGRFQVSRLRSFFPTDFHLERHIPYVEAHLIALKDGYQPMGLVEI